LNTRIPSLVSLRAFEAVARLKSFRDASEEICVTHAAVSHQVKALETLIGVKLLERTSRSVEMTPAGEQYYPAIREHIQGIVKATRRVQYPDEPDVILFQSYASFNTMWLQPRLADFLQNNPNTRVRIVSNFEDGDYDVHRFDIGVFNAPPFDDRFNYKPFFKTNIFPVCSPDYMSSLSDEMSLEQLRNFSLLSVPNTWDEPDDWDCWLDAADIDRKNLKFGPIFDNYPLVRDATLNSRAICIAREAFCKTDLERGRLVRPFDISVPEPGQWYLARQQEKGLNPHLDIFFDWMMEQAESDPTMQLF